MIDIKLNVTINNSFTELTLPIEEDMIFIDFILCLQTLLKQLSENTTTFDIYDLDFNRIALVGENEEIYIAEEYNDINQVNDLLNYDINTLEIIGLTSSVKKVLQEEYELTLALNNYKFEE